MFKSLDSVTRQSTARQRLSKANLLSSQTLGHQVNHGDVNKSLTRCRFAFVIFAQATRTIEPAKGAFDHPSSSQHDKAFGLVGAFDNLQQPVAGLLNPINQRASVSSIGPDLLQTREQRLNLVKQQSCTMHFLRVGCYYHYRQQQSQRVRQSQLLPAGSR